MMLRLAAVCVTFQVTGLTGKKAGTSVDITFRKSHGGHVLAQLLNAGEGQEWLPGFSKSYELQVTDNRLQEGELAEMCVRLSWFPERDEAMLFNLEVLVTFDNGAVVDRSFPNRMLSAEEQGRELTLGLFRM